jgi:Rad3-related DNA helicases
VNIDTSYFPYKFREDQDKLFSFIQEKIREKNLIISAPTGYGKTAVILAAILPYAKENDLKIIWTVRTGPETDRPIEELKK